MSFGPREEFARLVASRVLQPVDDQPVTSVVCFVIAARARRQGVATALLDAVINYAGEHGVEPLEAYPVDLGDKRASGAEPVAGPDRAVRGGRVHRGRHPSGQRGPPGRS